MALSTKQQLFIEEYLKTFNATDAYVAAYGVTNRATAASNGWRFVRENTEIADAIGRRLSESAMSADEVLMRLAEHARGDVGDYLTTAPNGTDIVVDLPKAIDANKTRLIKKLTQKRTTRTRDDVVEEDVVTSIEMYDAQAALGMIGKKHGLFVDRSENRNYDIDLSKLSNEQLERVAAGEDPLQVVLDGYVSAG
jgi:phage terminase small subunit